METMERIEDRSYLEDQRIGSRSTVTCNTSGRSVVQAIAQCEPVSRDSRNPENRRRGCCAAACSPCETPTLMIEPDTAYTHPVH